MCHFLTPDDASTLALIGMELRATSKEQCIYVESLIDRLSDARAKETGRKMMALVGCSRFANLDASNDVEEAAQIFLDRAGVKLPS